MPVRKTSAAGRIKELACLSDSWPAPIRYSIVRGISICWRLMSCRNRVGVLTLDLPYECSNGAAMYQKMEGNNREELVRNGSRTSPKCYMKPVPETASTLSEGVV